MGYRDLTYAQVAYLNEFLKMATLWKLEHLGTIIQDNDGNPFDLSIGNLRIIKKILKKRKYKYDSAQLTYHSSFLNRLKPVYIQLRSWYDKEYTYI